MGTPHHRQGIRRLLQADSPLAALPRHREHRQRLGPALQRQGRTRLEGEVRFDDFLQGAAHHNLAGLRDLHQACRHVHVIAKRAIRAASGAAIGADAHYPLGQSHL